MYIIKALKPKKKQKKKKTKFTVFTVNFEQVCACMGMYFVANHNQSHGINI